MNVTKSDFPVALSPCKYAPTFITIRDGGGGAGNTEGHRSSHRLASCELNGMISIFSALHLS